MAEVAAENVSQQSAEFAPRRTHLRQPGGYALGGVRLRSLQTPALDRVALNPQLLPPRVASVIAMSVLLEVIGGLKGNATHKRHGLVQRMPRESKRAGVSSVCWRLGPAGSPLALQFAAAGSFFERNERCLQNAVCQGRRPSRLCRFCDTEIT